LTTHRPMCRQRHRMKNIIIISTIRHKAGVTQPPSAVPVIPRPGPLLPGFVSRHAAVWFHRRQKKRCYRNRFAQYLKNLHPPPTCILSGIDSGIDAMCVRHSLSHSQNACRFTRHRLCYVIRDSVRGYEIPPPARCTNGRTLLANPPYLRDALWEWGMA
jgi:hypothetical protein